MTRRSLRAATHPSRASRRLAAAPAALAGVLLLLGAAPGLPAAAQSPEPTPSLTFAPLVTLPPVQAVPDALAGIPQSGYTLGDPNAPVTIEAWEDFQCPYCLRWTVQIEPQVIEAFVKPGLAKLTYRPLAFIGEESRWAAVAGDLAAEQDRFWTFQQQLFGNQLGENIGSFGLERLITAAENAGLDMKPFLDGLQLDQARERFAALMAKSNPDASALGINATPTITVNGVVVETPDFGSISSAVAAALSPAIGGSPAASPAAPAIPSASPAG
ncbi:MAG: thioredoxin domain-containing protein [Chloroflexota bacterium]